MRFVVKLTVNQIYCVMIFTKLTQRSYLSRLPVNCSFSSLDASIAIQNNIIWYICYILWWYNHVKFRLSKTHDEFNILHVWSTSPFFLSPNWNYDKFDKIISNNFPSKKIHQRMQNCVVYDLYCEQFKL
jgi:hypothetical protein